ncbi:MAG: pyridoxal phosphate-dependent aminotransferase [Eubacteriales bacterium]|nr:pyridoxal phosphate-dependent aminotransferase [Eubacteriales bacterium]
MVSEKMFQLGSKSSVIRETFEYGKKRAAEIGAENVFDFSLGNPGVPAPAGVDDTIRRLLDTTPSIQLHGYTSAPGDATVRAAIAADLNRRFGTDYGAGDLYMTTGAAAALSITLRALCCEGDEFIVPAPFFPEYRVFTEAAGGRLVVTDAAPDLQPDTAALAAAIGPHTKAVILNSPNNPSGAVFTRKTLTTVAGILRDTEKRYGHPIYILSDEPYREIVYDGAEVAWLPSLYADTAVCYSYSKSLSLPGERIGYILVPPQAADARRLYAAVCGAGRALGYVCASSLFQRVAAANASLTSDLDFYRRNRALLYENLCRMGYDCVRPDGAFYLFVRALEPDAAAFCRRAREHELLLVPSDDFGLGGYVRIAYCVPTETIRRSLPAFEALIASYQ